MLTYATNPLHSYSVENRIKQVGRVDRYEEELYKLTRSACPNLVAGVIIKRGAPVWNENQAAGLTSILLFKTPGFALFANSVAFSRAAWERTVPDSVISFLSAIAFTLRLASFN